jgi:hypothetical protein
MRTTLAICGLAGLVATGLSTAPLVRAASTEPAGPGQPSLVCNAAPVTDPTQDIDSNDQLDAVHAFSGTDAWAVGNYEDSSGNSLPLAERWDGTSWTSAHMPTVGNTMNQVFAVSGSSPKDVWAVGSQDSNGTNPFEFIEHWNGSAWSVASTPHAPFAQLFGVVALSTTNAWAVGDDAPGGPGTNPVTLVEHWNGVTWSVVATPPLSGSSSLDAVSAVNSTNIWAVGGHTANDKALIEHWNGVSWSVQATPSITGRVFLSSVRVISATDIWAAGQTLKQPVFKTLLVHWNGAAWTVVPSPNGTTNFNVINGLAPISATDIWAFGYQKNSTALALHWNGGVWSMVPEISGSAQLLAAAANAQSGRVWAVGVRNASHTYAQHVCPA